MSKSITFKKLFDTAVIAAMECDPRGKEFLENELLKRKTEFEKITDEKKKAAFDLETLQNPYADTRILYGDVLAKIEKIMVGIDVDAGEVLVVDRLNQAKAGIDLLVSHHPVGRASANFYEVMEMQADMLQQLGVPINQAEGALHKRMTDIGRRLSPANHNRVVDAARLLNISLCCMHTVADNHVHHFLDQLFLDKKPYYVEDIIHLLEEIPEYQIAAKLNNAPRLFAGSEKNRCGKIALEMTGGTSGSEEAIAQMANAGVGTLVVMHIPDEHRKNCEKLHINIVCAGHIPSDSLGLNLLFAAIKKKLKTDFDIEGFSGYTFVKR